MINFEVNKTFCCLGSFDSYGESRGAYSPQQQSFDPSTGCVQTMGEGQDYAGGISPRSRSELELEYEEKVLLIFIDFY